MKRSRKYAVIMVFISFVVIGVLQYMRPTGVPVKRPYIPVQEGSLSAFGEGYTNEFYSFNSLLGPGIASIEHDIVLVGNFIEEEWIIEEFANAKQVKPILYRYDSAELRIEEERSYDMIISEDIKKVSMANSNQNITHKIEANDSLSKLAKRYYNDESKWDRIFQANKNSMLNPHSLKIGQELLIPISPCQVMKIEAEL